MKRKHFPIVFSLYFFLLLLQTAVIQAQEAGKVKAWVITYDMLMELPDKKASEMNEEEKQMMGLMMMGKALAGGEEGEGILKAFTTAHQLRVEQKGLVSSVQISDFDDSVAYNLDSNSQTAYRIPLAMPKISTSMVGDSMVVVSSADGEIQLQEDTLTIAGFLCKKAVLAIPVEGTKQEIVIWYAPELPKLFWGEYDYLEKIPGMALKIAVRTNGMDVGIQALSLKEEQVDEALFQVPETYKIDDSFEKESNEY